jgi:DNA topoisomerase VI subunit A
MSKDLVDKNGNGPLRLKEEEITRLKRDLQRENLTENQREEIRKQLAEAKKAAKKHAGK